MSTLLLDRMQHTQQRQHTQALASAREAHRLRLIKLACMVALGICFWYSVPYYLPLTVDPNPAIAARNEAAAYEGNVTRQIAMPVIAFIAMLMAWRLPRRGQFSGRLLLLGVLYCAWAGASLLWSEEPSFTSKRLIVFAIDAGFAVALARTLSLGEMVLFGFGATGIVAILSLYVDLVQQHIFAPFDPDYRFTGVMTANYQAMNLVVSMMCGLTVARKRPTWMRWILPLVGLDFLLLLLTRSRLGTVIGLIVIAIIAHRMLRDAVRPATRALLLLSALTVLVPATVYSLGSRGSGVAESIFMMGRTDTENTSSLSNRTPLWAEVADSVAARPWLGFGYAGFWTPQRVERISADQGWMVPNGHNTYLDQAVSLGLPGALLYTMLLLGACVIAWRRSAAERSVESLFPALMLTWLALTSLAESVPLDPYLPTMLAYACVIKMMLAPGSECASEEDMPCGSILLGKCESAPNLAAAELAAATKQAAA